MELTVQESPTAKPTRKAGRKAKAPSAPRKPAVYKVMKLTGEDWADVDGATTISSADAIAWVKAQKVTDANTYIYRVVRVIADITARQATITVFD